MAKVLLIYPHIWTVVLTVLCFSPAILYARANMSPLTKSIIEDFAGPQVAFSAAEPSLDDVSPNCLLDLIHLLSSPDALVPVLDSFGKPSAGILVGNLAWLGHFDECMGVSQHRYCLVRISANLSAVVNATLDLPIQWGVCVPESCSGVDVENTLELLLGYLNVSWLTLETVRGSSVDCVNKPDADFNGGFISVCIVIGVLFLLCVAGSIVDHCLQAKDREASDAPLPHRVGLENGSHTAQQNLYGSLDNPKGDHVLPENQFSEKSPLLDHSKSPHHSMVTRETVTVVTRRPQSVWTRLILCFAFSRNIPKLLGTKQGEGGITCLNGIRVISMSWVILGHTLALVAQAGIGENLGTAFPAWLQSFSYQAILNAYFSVDSFFFLSGLLITYLTLKKMKESAGKIPWKWIYLHRYLRLTPALAMLILVFTFILPNMSQGPIWHSLDPWVDPCRSWWWTNILYINNFFPPAIGQNCVLWTWYLANDMQFFLISPLIIIPLFWYPAVGVSILSTLCVASFITTAVLVEQHGFQPGVLLSNNGHSMSASEPEGRFLPADSYMDVIYTKPYCRIPPYLVGMAMGYIIYRIGTKKIKLTPIMAAAGWAVAAALGMTVVYGLYPIYSGSSVPTTASSMAYTSLSTFTWGVALCWVVFACHYGYGGVIHDFLSWSLWVPLSRMTYSAYLLHPLVMYLYAFSQTVPIHWSTITVAYNFSAFFTLAYGCSFLMNVLVEFPFGNLEKMLQQGLAKKKP